MAMFTSQEKKNLTKLLITARDQDKVMTLNELHGYLFGLGIIPEMLMPSHISSRTLVNTVAENGVTECIYKGLHAEDCHFEFE